MRQSAAGCALKSPLHHTHPLKATPCEPPEALRPLKPHSPNNRKVCRRKNRVFFRGGGGHFPLAGRLVLLERCWLLLVQLYSAATTWSQHVGMGHRSSANRRPRPPALEHRHHGGSSRLGGPQAVAATRSALSYGAKKWQQQQQYTAAAHTCLALSRLGLSRRCGRPDADKAHRTPCGHSISLHCQVRPYSMPLKCTHASAK
jgi:hypothetical protein